MIYPRQAPSPPIARCVAKITERGPVTVASARGVTRMRDHEAFLEWLTSPTIHRPSSHVWLSPHSAGWDLLVTALLRRNYELRLSRRRGEYLGLWIRKAGQGFGLDADEEGRGWYGGSALDLVEVEPGLSDESEARATWEQLQALDAAVTAHWPGAALDCSIAATAVGAFKRYLTAPIGLARSIAAELTDLDAYGGGHIERFCGRGDLFADAAGFAPWEVDLSGAYPTAMQRLTVPGEFLGYGDEADVFEPGTLSTVAITVPERLYPPLRYRVGKHLYYPWGTLLGTWTAVEIRAAVAAGCRLERVLRVYCFEDRSEEFGTFADSLLAFRRLAPTIPFAAFAKSLAVQFVGALGSRPSSYRITTRPMQLSGCRFERPGLLAEPSFEPSERQILSAAATMTGGVAAWLGLWLRACELTELRAYYVHTDGGGTIGDPRVALDLCAELGRSDPELRFPEGHDLVPCRSGGAWKVEALRSARCYAPNRRIVVAQNGERRIVAGGISRTLTEHEIEAEMMDDRPHAWTRGARQECGVGGWTRPYHVADIDAEAAEAAELIVRQ